MNPENSSAQVTPETLQSSALAYTAQGFSVIPCRPDKKPYLPWTEFQQRGATAEEIKSWWRQWPKAMIGICTGEISGIFVIDCDTREGYEAIQKLLPDALLLPIARTPRGGWHLWFIYPVGSGITVGIGLLPGVDFRGEGGFVVAPPSVNGDGKAYGWQEGLSIGEVAPPELPGALRSLLLKKHLYNRGGAEEKTACVTERYETLQDVTIKLTKGHRDDSLFHIANSLIKGGMTEGNTNYILNIIADNCNPPFPENEIPVKIQSAIHRARRRERNFQSEVETWVSVTSGYWNVTECNQALQSVTKEEKTAVRVAVHRLCKAGKIEKHGDKDGCYRRIENDVEPIDFMNCNVSPLSIRYPFGIEAYIKTLPKNVIVVAGSPDAGKTALLLNIARMNQDRHEVHYFSSEMGKMELRERLSKFDCSLDSWRCRFWEKSSGFSDVIKPDAINIIDFLEVHSDFWQVGGMIKAIFDKLKKGIAVIAIQKPQGRDEGLGGQRGLEKPRLYLSMESGRIKIVKAKNWVSAEKNPNGLALDFKIIGGCKFHVTRDWHKGD